MDVYLFPITIFVHVLFHDDVASSGCIVDVDGCCFDRITVNVEFIYDGWMDG